MKRILSVAVAALAGTSTLAAAHVPEAEWEAFKAQYAQLVERVNSLEAENAQLKQGQRFVTVEDLEATQAEVASLKSQNKATSWAETVKWKGDFRYRYESIDVEDVDTRERHRIRARAAMVAKLPSNTEVGLGLATGGNDPVSTNQTLGGGGSTKDIRLDLAYAKWKATDNLYLQAGKYKTPFYTPQKSALIFDGDFRPEGIGAGWSNDMFFTTVSGSWLESDTRNDEDLFTWGLQGGAKFNLGGASLTAALAYHDFPTKGLPAVFDDDFFGNSVVDGVYEFDYEVVSVGADLSLNLMDMPFSVFADYVQNQDADDYDTGYIVGTKLGKASGKGTWQLAYQYQDLEADATLGLLSDSDFAGGGTDGKGHRISGAYGINKRWNVGFTWFVNNEAGEKALADEGGALDYDRIMIDTQFKY